MKKKSNDYDEHIEPAELYFDEDNRTMVGIPCDICLAKPFENAQGWWVKHHFDCWRRPHSGILKYILEN